MNELLSGRVHRALWRAEQLAKRRGDPYIGTEHLLLGLLEEGGAAVKVLEHLALSTEELADRVSEIQQVGPDVVKVQSRPFTPRAKQAIELALVASCELGHTCVDTQHVLLGLIRQSEGLAGEVLRQFTTPELVYSAVQQLGETTPEAPYTPRRKPLQCSLASLFVLTTAIAVTLAFVPLPWIAIAVLVTLELIFTIGLAVAVLILRDRWVST